MNRKTFAKAWLSATIRHQLGKYADWDFRLDFPRQEEVNFISVNKICTILRHTLRDSGAGLRDISMMTGGSIVSLRCCLQGYQMPTHNTHTPTLDLGVTTNPLPVGLELFVRKGTQYKKSQGHGTCSFSAYDVVWMAYGGWLLRGDKTVVNFLAALLRYPGAQVPRGCCSDSSISSLAPSADYLKLELRPVRKKSKQRDEVF